MGESQPGTGHHTSKRIAVCRRIASATSTGESVVNKSFLEDRASEVID
jgi:hypothetical protein